jgi:hypothetical protein
VGGKDGKTVKGQKLGETRAGEGSCEKRGDERQKLRKQEARGEGGDRRWGKE